MTAQKTPINLHVRISPEAKRKIDEMAASSKRSLASWVEVAIDDIYDSFVKGASNRHPPSRPAP